MNASSPPHPTDQILYAYGLGKLGDPAASAVDSHLEACDACRQRVSELSGDSFLGRLRDAGARPDTPAPGPPRAGVARASSGPSAPPVPDPALAATLPPELADNPQYEVIRELGRGGMGVVYLARNKLMDRLEVLKVLNKEMLERKGTFDRFLREIRSAARLNHPHVVGAYSALQIGPLLVFAMEYVEGADLSKLVKSRGPLAVMQACSMIYQAALGLQHAHEQGMVHRDIKPGNLMFARQGQRATVKLLDFGLAKATSENPIDGSLTREGQMLGTVDFIAPEQSVDAQQADIRADIYSLGCTLYYLLTGAPPFGGTSLASILQAHHSMEARPLNLVRPEVPVELAVVVGKMMAKERERRYQTPAEVAEALRPFFKPKVVGSGSSGGGRSQPGQQAVDRTSAGVVSPASEPAGAVPVTAPCAAVPPNDPALMWKSLVAIPEPEHLSDARTPTSEARRRRPPWLGPALAVGIVLLLGLVVGWAAGVFKFKTEEGDLVFSGLPEHAVVSVDNKVCTVEWPGGKGPAKVTVPVGEHRVKVELNGVEVYGEEVKIETGQKKWIKVRLVRPESRKVAETNPWPEALPLAGQRFPQGSRFLAMSRDCRRVAVTSSTGVVQVIEAPDVGRLVEVKGQPRSKNGTPFWIPGADFSPDGKYLAGICHENPGRIWDASTGEEVRQLSEGGRGESIAYSSDGKRLAGAGLIAKVVEVWDAMSGERLVALGPHSVVTVCVAFSPDGRRLASGGGAIPGNAWLEKFGLGAELKVWDPETGTCSVLEGHPLRVNGVAFSPDGGRLASASFDKTVKVWDLATRKCLVTFDKHQVPVVSVRFSPDGRLIASIGAENPVRVWDSATGREVAILTGLPGHPGFVQFSPEGRWIYSGGRDTLKAWETPASDKAPVTPSLPAAVSQPPTPVRDGTSIITNSIGMKLALIPAGEFLMGSPDSDEDAEYAEGPQHRVRITRPFYMGVTEVTQGQYRAMTGQIPSNFKGSDDLPVEGVSWLDAVDFCNAVGRAEGLPPFYRVDGQNVAVRDWKGAGYRLPTEAEREYACRAKNPARYSFGDDPAGLGEYAWVDGNSDNQTHPVGQKRPNAFGLFDMHGNVREWCSDGYQDDFYARSPVDDPVCPFEGASDRVIRGGSWNGDPQRARSADRRGLTPEDRRYSLGFRLARVQSEASLLHPPVPQVIANPPAPPIEEKKPAPTALVPDAQPTPAPEAAPKTIAKKSTGPGPRRKTTPASKDAPKSITNSIDMMLVLIPASEFDMGSPDSDKDAEDNEKPQHRVRITRPFYLGVTEVTQGQYRAVTGQSPSHFNGSDDLPVERVSWTDAVAFCDKLSALEKRQLGGARYRLPTEAEWEYACRGGSTTRYSFGDDAARLGEFAWFYGNSGGKTHPVGEKPPNAFKLYDMHGSVREWCWDSFDAGYYGQSPRADPLGPSQAADRVNRGGAWDDGPRGAWSADRHGLTPGDRFNNVGFRVARVQSGR